jgi:hypothetical protein
LQKSCCCSSVLIYYSGPSLSKVRINSFFDFLQLPFIRVARWCIFSNQKFQNGQILEGLTMEDILVYSFDIWSI